MLEAHCLSKSLCLSSDSWTDYRSDNDDNSSWRLQCKRQSFFSKPRLGHELLETAC